MAGAGCCLHAARTGRDVGVVARGAVPGGTTAAGEGSPHAFTAGQRTVGVRTVPVTTDQLPALEPHLAAGMAAARLSAVRPGHARLAAAHLLRASGSRLHTGRTVTGVLRMAD